MTKDNGGSAMQRQAGGIGWLGLGIYVAAWDAWALRCRHETLSSAFGRSIRHPRALPFVALGWGLLTAHLFGRPRALRRLDPIAAVARRVER